jgi:hypothetical protein
MICFCKRGMMAECRPEGHDRRECRWYQKHSFLDQCSFLNKDMNNHCWSENAQSTPYELPTQCNDSKQSDKDLPVAVIAEPSCNNCFNYPCQLLIQLDREATNVNGMGLTHQDLITIAKQCNGYISGDELKDLLEDL